LFKRHFHSYSFNQVTAKRADGAAVIPTQLGQLPTDRAANLVLGVIFYLAFGFWQAIAACFVGWAKWITDDVTGIFGANKDGYFNDYWVEVGDSKFVIHKYFPSFFSLVSVALSRASFAG